MESQFDCNDGAFSVRGEMTGQDAREAVVSVEGLKFSYGAQEVLHGLSFVLRKGEVVGLLGPNGAGKSTTIKILTGILTPGDGSIFLAGHSMPDEATEAKKRIGYVPESGAMFQSLTAQEHLELIGRLQNVPEATLQLRIDRFLDLFGLAEDRHRRLDGYSKGMRQKVLLSMAMLHNPDIVLLDEPLTGLDVRSGLIVRDLISALAAEGKGILYSSHVLDVVERVCDRVLIVNEGRLVADGSLEVLKTSTESDRLEDVFRFPPASVAFASGGTNHYELVPLVE